MKEKIVIVEDDAGVRFFLQEALSGEGYGVDSFESFEDALPSVNGSVDLVITDIQLPGMDGLSAIDEIRKKTDTPILIITAHGTKKNAMEAIERGASDFFIKPIALEELKIIVKRTLATRNIKRELEQVKEQEIYSDTFHGVIGKSIQMKDIFRTVDRIAGKDITVLITGETGAGKEEIAKLLHRLSRRNGHFVAVNCASIPDNLLESELFGHEKGAFTGAFQSKQGKFEFANGGTLLLDEIGEMSPMLQAKLLRAIETKEVERLGDLKKRKVDVRIIGTTNRDLEKEITAGKFREDLYYRIAQIHMIIPPLRERGADINPLIDYFLLAIGKSMGSIFRIDAKARATLLDYHWKGNVRELNNVLRNASAMCEGGVITRDDLPLYINKGEDLTGDLDTEQNLDAAIFNYEKKLVLEALAKTKNSQAKAAKLLGITERSMWYRVKKFNIDLG